VRTNSPPPEAAECEVCKLRDARALITVKLASEEVTLCGSHALMYRRTGRFARTRAELRELLRDRRGRERRARAHDELAAMLTAAFAGERRRTQRRTA
jgi:hypothetical protein